MANTSELISFNRDQSQIRDFEEIVFRLLIDTVGGRYAPGDFDSFRLSAQRLHSDASTSQSEMGVIFQLVNNGGSQPIDVWEIITQKPQGNFKYGGRMILYGYTDSIWIEHRVWRNEVVNGFFVTEQRIGLDLGDGDHSKFESLKYAYNGSVYCPLKEEEPYLAQPA